jgi:hypothetical protein
VLCVQLDHVALGIEQEESRVARGVVPCNALDNLDLLKRDSKGECRIAARSCASRIA